MNKQIQSYQILEKIGTGGMGFVYKAKHLFREEIVAIKTLFPHLVENPDIKNRFISEAKILSTLKHPNIVRVLDFIEEQDGLHLVMEYVEGRTLNKMIGKETGPIPAVKALPIFEQILSAVEYAHSKGVIHRDIKPSNIMVTKENVVKVMDFGIAHIEGSEMTRTGTKLGTLYYMSPEAIRGERTDERTDVYSLGVTLYEMLAGKLQYKETGEQLSEFMLMQKIMTEELKDPREYYPYIPDWLVEVVKRATEKDKNKRIRSVREFIGMLKDIEKDEGKIQNKIKEELKSKKEIKIDFELYKTLQGQIGSIRSVAFSPDGEILASGSGDETIKLWEISTGKLLKTLKGHISLVESLAFSPDGEILASGSSDETIKLWEISTGKLLKTLKGHSHYVKSVAFSPNGEILASGSSDKTIKLWEISKGKLLKTLERHSDYVNSVSFSPDGEILASGSDDKTIKLWEINTGKLLKTLEGHFDWVWSVAFSPDGEIIASGSSDETTNLWEISTGKLLKTLEEHSDVVLSVAFSPDGEILASGSKDGTIKLWKR